MASLINLILDLFIIAIVARVILSFIIPLSGARPHPIVVSINTMVNQVTEPILGPIRRNLPTFGGFDFSPMAVLIVIWLLRVQVVPRI